MQLEGLSDQQPPLETQIAEAKQAVIDYGEPSQPEAIAGLNEKRVSPHSPFSSTALANTTATILQNCDF